VRHVRGLNPLAEADAALLTAISDPKWFIQGLRNRDLVAALYPTASADPSERRRRSARVTRLLRLLRGHGLLEKIPGTHRYQVGADARTRLQAVLACRNANPDQLVTNAA
jgi:predicted pyridoxine 5'-phosphate oxidase superfamily flavin-nucleotide-binding protein